MVMETVRYQKSLDLRLRSLNPATTATFGLICEEALTESALQTEETVEK